MKSKPLSKPRAAVSVRVEDLVIPTYLPAPPWREALRNGNTPEEWGALRTMR